MNIKRKKDYFTASTGQMKELDNKAINECGIPSLDLMETAAGHAADAVVHVLEEAGKAAPAGGDGAAGTAPARIGIFCGAGNNGGDGIAAARLLMAEGYEVRCFMAGNPEKMTSDSSANAERLDAAGGACEVLDSITDEVRRWSEKCDCIMDALFGVGLSRDIGGLFGDVIDMINEIDCPVVSCDIPSGVHGDTGKVMGKAVKADITVTFSCGKPGLYEEPGKDFAGDVAVVDIGIPEDLYEKVGIEAD